MLSTRRRPFPIGGSKGVTLPGGMQIADEVSIAASERLLLMDTTGELSENKLLQFFIECVEPAFHRWLESQKRAQSIGQGEGFVPQQAKGEVIPQEARVVVPPGVLPGPPVYDATCPNPFCQGNFRWDLSRGDKGFCPYCGAYLWFRP